jgi:hypothetical protein
MGKRAFEGILNEVVGRLPVTAQQGTGEPAQPGNLRFDQAARSGITSPFERRLPGSHDNTRPMASTVLGFARVPVGVLAIITTLPLTA